MPQQPNVLLFIMDDQTPDTIGILGNPHIRTPHLDRLCERGVFLRPYTTVPVCTPGRAELLTGRTAFRNGCRWFGEPIDSDIELLPMAFRKAGYHTCHIGKWHNDGHPRDRGYEETHVVFPRDQVGPYNGHTFTYRDGDDLLVGHSTEMICSEAMRFVDTVSDAGPWFCYVALHSPHDPRVCPEPWMSMYDDCMPPLPENFMPEHPFDNGDMMIRDERLAGFPRRQHEVRRHRADYYAMISHHDHWIGHVLTVLRQRGMMDNTIVMFTSDHGLACGCHGLMGKENLYEHSARVPLIMAGPNLPAGTRLDRDCLCGHYDVMPTLMGLLGIESPDTCEGIPIAPVFGDTSSISRSTICAGYRDCMRMARNNRFKMIYYPHIDRTQLFDILQDPDETNDLLLEWRRDTESRCCPPPGNPFGEPRPADPDPREGASNNPMFVPLSTRDECDRVVAELRAVLLDWQRENQDPVLTITESRWNPS